MRKRLALCIFNRASFARVKALIEEIANEPELHLTVLVSSSVLLEEFGSAHKYIIKDDSRLVYKCLPIEYTDYRPLDMSLAASRIWEAFARHFSETPKYDAVIVVADRFETLPCAAAAAYQNIPLVHIQGGEVTSNLDEKVRHMVTKGADLHFVATKQAKQYLIQIGEHPHSVHYTGCPSLDLVHQAGITRRKLRDKYFLCIFHPETGALPEKAHDDTLAVLTAAIEYCKRFGYRCYWYWPNPDPGRAAIASTLEAARKECSPFLIKAVNQEPEAFLQQLACARMIIGNSSCGLREASFLGVPAINIGSRQSLRERSLNVFDIEEADSRGILDLMIKMPWRFERSWLYGDGNASKRIVRALLTTDFETKEPLAYPTWERFRNLHTGEARYRAHRKKIIRPQKELLHAESG